MIKANNLQSFFTRLSLYADQLLGSDVVPIVRRVRARVTAAHSLCRLSAIFGRAPKQHATALVRVSLLSVLADGFVLGLFDRQHY